MKQSTLKIGTQLEIGFSILLIMVILLGVVSNFQTNKLLSETDILFNHPFQVSNAISKIETNILMMDIAYGAFLETNNEGSRMQAIQEMEMAASESNKFFNVVKERFMGNRTDVDRAYIAFSTFRSLLEGQVKNTDAKSKKNIEKAKIQELRDDLFAKMSIIENFANNKATSSYNNSVKLHKDLKVKLIVIIILIILISLFINIVLLRSIQKPLRILTKVTQLFRNGNYNARSYYNNTNEFGLLSDSFNKLADQIQLQMDLSEKKASLSAAMLIENDTHTFFRSTLAAMLKLTNAQMAAIYVLSEDQNKLELYESIGLGESFRKTFDLNTLEGEMGPVLATNRIQLIKEVQKELPFVFETVYGSIRPREIMTIPLHSGDRVIATIHLANLNTFDAQSQLLVESALETLSARISGIMSTQKIKLYSEKMEVQNRELEIQKTEMSKQSETLLNQNTELEIQKKELDDANKLKTIFLSNMSHELRTPLNSVIALSGVLSRRLTNKIPQEEYSYLDVIERNGKHLLSLINDILDLSRIEAGREDLEILPFDATMLLNDMVDMILPQAKSKGIELIFKPENKELNVCSDLKKCRHILQNIIGNAVKFTETGQVEIRSKKEGEFILIEVRDTGIGIAESQQKHIFEEFRQADNSTSRRFGGTGLGLSIAKKYAELLGGSITVKSKPGDGSIFTLTLPIECSGEIPEHKVVHRNTESFQLKKKVETDGKTILLVDDSEPAIIQLCDVLEEGGYQMQIARNGLEALERISETVPDAMILDLMMPDMDGFEVLKTIREEDRTAHVPVLILTAKHITKEELRFLKRNNIHQLVQKGDINRKDLLKSVQEMAFKKKPIILVVEDNPDNMLTAKALLSDQYQVVEAIDGNEALLMTRLHMPNLILMDIELPERDGIETFKVIRKDVRLQKIPIIALTASAMTSEREAILAHGFDGYIAKPIDEKIFTETIKNMIYG